MIVEKPIFIVGVGRSGSSIFHKMLSEHTNLAWLSYICDIFPKNLRIIHILVKIIDSPLIGKFIKRFFGPGEGYNFWEEHCKGFSEPCRDLLAQDVTNKHKERIPKVFSKILTKRRNRILIKLTGWSRIGFLREIFNDAKFIHVKRDRRAVINSLIDVYFWSGWRGPLNWRWGELTPAQVKEWELFDRSFIALAGIELKILSKAMEKARKFVDEDNFLEVDYEQLCKDPLGVFKEVVKFCELEWSSKFENAIKNYHLKNTNYKWQKDLTIEQKKIVEYFANDF